jgi:hypothetical protein
MVTQGSPLSDETFAFSAPDSYEGSVDNDPSVPGYVNEAGGTTVSETVTWSQVRYTGYCLLVVAVTPSPRRPREWPRRWR